MLILSRKKNESIKIGDEIELTVISVEGDQVKIGIQAPKHIEIYRKEIYLSIKEENNYASLVTENLMKQLKTQHIKNIKKE